MQNYLENSAVYSEELETLLKGREEGKVDFILVDVREEMEYRMGHIKGVDALKPMSAFSEWAEALFGENQERTIIFTCRSGNRSGQVQRVFKQHGHKGVINHAGGIISYRGEIEK